MVKKIGVLIISLILIASFLIGSLSCPKNGIKLTIQELKGSSWEDYVGKTVQVEGIFVRDPLPILVTDLDIVLANMPMPEDQYVLLDGAMAESLDANDLGGAVLRVTGIVNADDSSDDTGVSSYIVVADYLFDYREIAYSPKHVSIQMIEDPNPDPKRYAILFSGGINKNSNKIRYWNDLKFMYSTLIGTLGFDKKNIAVLYWKGTGEDNEMPVHYSATQDNLTTVFNLLREHSSDDDLIFFFTTNHGGGFWLDDPFWIYTRNGQFDNDGDEPNDQISEDTSKWRLDLNNDGDEKDIVSWDECLHTSEGSQNPIFDDDLRIIMSDLKFETMIVVMEQCFSGGMIHDISMEGDMIIISAAGEYEPSWGGSTSVDYNEFSYHFTCAINKADPDGNAVDADSNNDGNVSLVEAFNYARSNDTTSETPWYEDSGDGIPHSGNMPASGEGTLGSGITLEP